MRDWWSGARRKLTFCAEMFFRAPFFRAPRDAPHDVRPFAPSTGAWDCSRVLPLVFACAFGAGCQAGYVVQQGLGYIRLIREEVPLKDLEVAEKVAPGAADKLRWVEPTLRFCRTELGLDPGD